MINPFHITIQNFVKYVNSYENKEQETLLKTFTHFSQKSD